MSGTSSECTTAQNFCSTCQTVKEYDELKFKFTDQPEQGESVNGTWKDEVITGLKKIHDFGEQGTKKPSKEEIDSLDKILSRNYCCPEDLNEIIIILDTTTSDDKVDMGDHLLGSYFEELVELINDYELSADSCNTCNSGCNTNCQANSQGGGGGGGGCLTNCEGEGACACMGCQTCYFQTCHQGGCNQCGTCLRNQGTTCPNAQCGQTNSANRSVCVTFCETVRQQTLRNG